jgi:L-lactate dehydrogenase complex protein LldG
MEARNAVLERIRTALAAGGHGARPPLDGAPALLATLSPLELVARFVERVRDYRAEVVLTDDVPGAVAEALDRHGAHRVGIASDLPVALRPTRVQVVVDTALAPRELDALDGALTTCAGACAETGTVALDGGPGQGRRALTLIPDLHVCVVSRAAIVQSFSELLARLAPAVTAGRPLVLISGPSATSDIGLERIEGVHGPRTLVVIVGP